MKNAIILFVGILLVTSCSVYKEVDVVKVNDFELVEYSEDLVEIDLDITVDNPNSYKVKLVSSDINLIVNGIDFGKLKLKEVITLPKKSKSKQTLKVLADYETINSGLMANAVSFLFTKTVQVQAKGEVKGKALGIAKKVDVDFKEEISLDDLDLGF